MCCIFIFINVLAMKSTLTNFQVLKSYFSEEEITNFSSCIPQKGIGNIVNDETVWNITGLS